MESFAFISGMDCISLRTATPLTRHMGNFRNFITDRFGSETADKVVHEYESERLNEETISEIHIPQLNALATPCAISCSTTKEAP